MIIAVSNLIVPDSYGRKPERPEETHTEEPVRHDSTYTSYGRKVEYVYRYVISLELPLAPPLGYGYILSIFWIAVKFLIRGNDCYIFSWIIIYNQPPCLSCLKDSRREGIRNEALYMTLYLYSWVITQDKTSG